MFVVMMAYYHWYQQLFKNALNIINKEMNMEIAREYHWKHRQVIELEE